MGLGINTNISSLNNIKQLNRNESALNKTFQQLSSGKKINSAKDNAAGLAIVEQFASQIIGANQGYKNINDGISLAQTAEGFTNQISDLSQRARELAVQSSNGLLTDSDRAALQTEFSNIQQEVQRITDSAEFNGQSLLNNASTLSFQADANSTDQVDVNTYDLQGQLTSDNFFAADISTQAGANAALSSLDDSLSSINTVRADYGATISRFESIGDNLLNKQVNLEAAKSRILDTDYAQATSDRTKNMILNQAGIAIQGYTSISQNQVMNLLGS